jgi:predicted dehydrogenase
MSAPALAVYGTGHMGSLHAEKLVALAQEGVVSVAGVYDLDPERAAELAGRLGIRALRSHGELVEAADATCLAVPTVLHARIAEELLRSGLDVLVEKPLATSREDARRLIDTAREHSRVLQVGHVERFSRAYQAIRPALTRPRFIEVHRIGPYPGRATDVGVVLDLMIHDLDIVCHLAGADVERVEAVGVPVLSTTDDIANARVTFANGCILNITASRVSVERLRRIRVFQSDAYISIDFASHRITLARRKGEPGGEELPEISVETLELDSADALLAQDRAFADSVRQRSEPLVTGEDGFRALDLALRIQEAIPPLEDLAG